ncbi:unnamed protein product, partial [Effrenium voratum]
EVWRLSKSQLAAVVAAARLAGPGLLFGATLRWEEGEGEPEATKPLAFEWAEGPAADPLQLALKLRLKEEMCLQLEVTSGGWSDWSETWSLEDGSLEASLCLALALPGEGHVVLRQSKQRGSCEAVPGGRGRSHAETAELLRRHLTAGDGVLAVLGVSSLRYRNSDGSAPCWRPRELRRLEGRG